MTMPTYSEIIDNPDGVPISANRQEKFCTVMSIGREGLPEDRAAIEQFLARFPIEERKFVRTMLNLKWGTDHDIND
jgi:hypothetical protein